jgi:hypothetical protein
VSADLHYGKWGGSPFGALTALLHTPGVVFAHLAAPERLSYLPRVLLPLALLPLAAPRYLLVALPPLALNLLSAFPTASALYSHYLTPAVPPLVLGALAGAEALRVRLAGWRARLPAPPAPERLSLGLLLAAALAGNALASGLPWARDFELADYHAGASTPARLAVLARIPAGVSVQAPDPLLPHLAERRLVFRGPPPERAAEYVVLDVAHRRRFAHQESLLRTREEPSVRGWLARPDHRVVLAKGDLIVLHRGESPRGGLVRSYFIGRAPSGSGRALTACLAIRGAQLRGKHLELDLIARSACPADLAIRFGPDNLPSRVDLLFDGLLSPAQLSRGDLLRSRHALSVAEQVAIEQHGLYVGALRTSGARPSPGDPRAIPVRVGD